MSKFKVGDRVVVKDSYYRVDLQGKHGTIKGMHKTLYCVEFDEPIFLGHDCDGCLQRRLWLVYPTKTFRKRKIDGNKTIAVLKDGEKVVKKAEAKCSPEDTFDFNIGANLAFDRLFEKDRDFLEVAKDTIKTKVKSDEYIKIKEDFLSLKKGDIKKVLWLGGFTVWLYDDVINDGKIYFLPKEYYVVLENYNPDKTQVREVKRKARKGEYIKLIKTEYSFDKVGDILRVNGRFKFSDMVVVLNEDLPRYNHYSEEMKWLYKAESYVVLENYKPEEKPTPKTEEKSQEEPKPKRDTDFKVGDRVRFRSWEDMEKEYGVDKKGNIKCRYTFARPMKYLCGTYATITRIISETWVELKDFSTKGDTDWNYSTDMLEKASKK